MQKHSGIVNSGYKKRNPAEQESFKKPGDNYLSAIPENP